MLYPYYIIQAKFIFVLTPITAFSIEWFWDKFNYVALCWHKKDLIELHILYAAITEKR